MCRVDLELLCPWQLIDLDVYLWILNIQYLLFSTSKFQIWHVQSIELQRTLSFKLKGVTFLNFHWTNSCQNEPDFGATLCSGTSSGMSTLLKKSSSSSKFEFPATPIFEFWTGRLDVCWVIWRSFLGKKIFITFKSSLI